MKRRPGVSTVVLAAVLALVAAFAMWLPGIASQTATPDAQDGHPIVGAWQWINNPDSPAANPSYAVFNAGGTYVELDQPIGVGFGAWEATGPRTANLTIVFQDTDVDPNVLAPGTSTYRIAAEVDAKGNTITATGDLTLRDATGAVISTEPFTGTATRVVAEAPEVAGSPEATPAG
jgi:hypothetical protein